MNITKQYLYQPLVCNYNWLRDVNVKMSPNKVLLLYCHIQRDIVIRTSMDTKTRKFEIKLKKAAKDAISYYHSLIELTCKNTDEEEKYKKNINILYFMIDDLER